MRSIPAELKLALIKRALSGEKVARLCREIGVARKTFYSWLKKYNNSKPNVAKIKLRDRRFAKRFSFKTLYPKERLLLISKYLNHEASVATLCRQFGVSRKTFYKWFVRYQSKGENALYDARVRGQAHPKAVTPQRQQEVLNYVAWNPSYSVHKLNSQLDFIGHHGIQNLLSREGLNTYERRLAYARASQESGVRVKVAPTYVPEIPAYRWRMLFAPFKTVPKLLLARPIRLDSARLVAGILTTLSIFLPLSLIFLWLSSIVGAPQESSTVGLIFASVALFFGLFFFLYSMKYYLTILMVLRLAQGGGATSEGKESRGSQGSRESGESRGLGGQISRIFSKLGIGKFLHFRGVFGQRAYRVNPLLVNLEKVKLEAGSRPFVSIHVAVYNEKKVVERLIAACTSQEWSRDSRVDDGRLKVDLEAGGSKVDNPESNFYPQDPSSSFHPPSSIANYEVVIVDDSTDETTEIAKQSLIALGYSGNQVIRQSGEPIPDNQSTRIPDNPDQELFTFTKADGPVVKLIHRGNRSGFKGGALQEALRVCDPKAEYICVFDADFVPYADTIEQFVKTFAVLDGRSSGNQAIGLSGSNPDNPNTPAANSSTSTHPRGARAHLGGDEEGEVSLGGGHIAAVQGYQWHVLNKSQTWVTRGVRTEYAGSYVIERSGCEIYGGLKQIAGSVYGIRADVLRKFGWGTSITEDFELTLRLYEAGYKVAFTPYIQTPAEAVSTIKRLIRQRMRWAEGASFNVKIMLPRILFGRWVEAEQLMVDDGSLKVDNPASTFQHQNPPSSFHPLSSKVWVPSKLTLAEKLEFIYLAPYYLQAAFFVVGTICWFLSEAVFGARLPFWTAAFGWSLVFTNLLALPLMNIIGLFLEESDERDYVGILSFVALSYIVVPFQAYAAIKGFLEREEGPWFRTPKTGLVTDVIKRGRFHRLIAGILGKPEPAAAQFLIPNYSNYSNQIPNPNDQDNLGQLGIRSIRSISHPYLSLATAHNRFQNFQIRPRHIRWVGNLALGVIISITVLLSLFAPLMTATTSYAADPILRTVSDSQKEVDRAKIDQGTEDGGEKGEEITTPRAISKTTKGGKKLEFIFHEEARVRVKLEHREIEFETEKVFGQRVNPKRSRIKADKEVVYEEIIPGIDLKYSITNDLLVEEVILKTPDAAAHLGGVPQAQHHLRGGNASEVSIIQTLRTVDVKVVSPDPGAFGFFADDGKELFRFGAPFAKDAGGAVSNDLSFTLDKPFDFAQGYRLTKTLGESAKTWLTDPQRAYPVSIDPSVIVSGGIVETETQFGGLQRKIVYMSGANGGAAWYAFYNDGADVFYKRCLESSACDEAADWSAAQDLDTGDADNYNPTIAVSGNFIVVFWIDLSANAYEGRRFDVSTAFAHTLGTLCTSASLGTLSSTFMVSVALLDNDTGYVAYSDTSSDTEFGVELFFTLSGICTTASANFAGLTITNDSRLTAGDRPVLVPINSTGVDMIFQDGDLSYSRLHDVNWSRQNITIASVTDNIYSVTTDGTTVWILTVSGTTATNMYKCCTADIVETQVDSDAGATGHDSISDIDMFCVAADDCKIVYTDDIDTTPTLIFVDCNDEDCSTKTVTTLDADIGDSLDQAGASVFCVTDGTSVSGNCKIAYGDDMDTTPLLKVIDCTNDTDCSTNTSGTVDTNLGNAASVLHTSIDCPADDDCKITYNDTGLSDFFFVDCSTIACSTGNTVTQIDSASGTAPRSDLDCSAGADNCKFVYNDANATGGCADADSICFVDCSAAECGTGRTLTVVDVDAGVTNNASPVSIDCVGGDTDCKLVYGDGTDEAMYFVDCGDATCTVANATIQSIDNTVAGANTSRSFGAAMDCTPGVADCKIVYPDDTGNSVISFADCDDATCSPIGSTEVIPGARFNGTIQCLTTANCKLAYYDGTAETDPTVQFLDCDVADCLPSATSLTAPWTGQTNVTSVSLSLDTTNNALYANILKDTSEQAYFKSTDKSTISWSAETSYAFTAGDLGHISTPEKGAGTTQIGAVLRQGANFEFAVVPERIWFLMGVLPFLPRLFKKMKSRRRNL